MFCRIPTSVALSSCVCCCSIPNTTDQFLGILEQIGFGLGWTIFDSLIQNLNIAAYWRDLKAPKREVAAVLNGTISSKKLLGGYKPGYRAKCSIQVVYNQRILLPGGQPRKQSTYPLREARKRLKICYR
jgi:hypothetical protein